ncbi:MAG: efflux RND transporter periplasmic adaptor subunit [Hyphomicrobiaceae bacterium]|nr:efflux RND transporter periplasmic adaptor subunit [Hyphomicrobiaceae bacterium]
MKRFIVWFGLIAVAAALAGLHVSGKLAPLEAKMAEAFAKKPEKAPVAAPAPLVSVVAVMREPFVETVLVTGTVVPREEILVSPEISGQRILEILVDEGDRVKKGQVLARLVTANLEAQIAQNRASQARASAAIAQAESMIEQARANLIQAEASLKRAAPLKKQGYLAESTYDQRLAAARTGRAQLTSAQDGLRLAKAEKAQAEAQLRELQWRLGNTEIRAPADGLVSRRSAKIGSVATSTAEPMFRIIKNGEVELLAELTADQLARVNLGKPAQITVTGAGNVVGTVRLISPEIDRTTRLGTVRIALPKRAEFRIGAFGRGTIATARSVGLSLPLSAVMYTDTKRFVLKVDGSAVRRQFVETGLRSNGSIEITAGLNEGEHVVAKSGTFLRDGDKVRPVLRERTRVSGVN